MVNTYADDMQEKIFLLAAKSEDASCEVLNALSNCAYLSVRIAVANNENTPINALEKLAVDGSALVALAVIRNPKAGASIFKVIKSKKYDNGYFDNEIACAIHKRVVDRLKRNALWNEYSKIDFDYYYEYLNLSTRAQNCLCRSFGGSFKELLDITMDDLRNLKNCGPATVKEIVAKFAKNGIYINNDGKGHLSPHMQELKDWYYDNEYELECLKFAKTNRPFFIPKVR